MTKRKIDDAWFKKRQKAERRFQLYGQLALATAMLMLVILLGSIVLKGLSGFTRTEIALPITLSSETLGIQSAKELQDLSSSAYTALIKASLRAMAPEVTSRKEKRALYGIISDSAGLAVKNYAIDNPASLGSTKIIWLPASSPIDLYVKHHDANSIKDIQSNLVTKLEEKKQVRMAFNACLLYTSPSPRDLSTSRMPSSA